MKVYIVLALLFGLLINSAYAESIIPDDLAKVLTGVARENLPRAVMQDGTNVPKETEEELRHSILPLSFEKNIIQHGVATNMVEVCGLDSDLFYLQYMQKIRKNPNLTQKQLAYIGLLHGVAMGFFKESIVEKGCPDETRNKIKQQYFN